VRLDPLPGDAAAVDEALLEVGLDLERAPTLAGLLGQRVEHRLPPRDVRLVGAGELVQEPHGRRVGQRIGGIGVVDVRAHQVRLQHAVDRDEPVDGRLQLPHVLAQAREISVRGVLAVASGAQLLQPLGEQLGVPRVVVDVVAEGRLEGELPRRMTPAAEHLHQLDLEIAVAREPLRVLRDGEAPSELPAIDDGHLALHGDSRLHEPGRLLDRHGERLADIREAEPVADEVVEGDPA
jgi:hypothetical protein